jgi:hypothetical protein
MGTRNGASALSARDAEDWEQAHAALSRLARERAALDAEEGRGLLRALRSAAHVHLGFGSFAEYIERLFRYRPRSTLEKLRVAEALETLPRLEQALETGAVSWCAARELTRVAVPDTEPAWLDAARGKTLRELEALVASKAPGDEPDAPSIELPRGGSYWMNTCIQCGISQGDNFVFLDRGPSPPAARAGRRGTSTPAFPSAWSCCRAASGGGRRARRRFV